MECWTPQTGLSFRSSPCSGTSRSPCHLEQMTDWRIWMFLASSERRTPAKRLGLLNYLLGWWGPRSSLGSVFSTSASSRLCSYLGWETAAASWLSAFPAWDRRSERRLKWESDEPCKACAHGMQEHSNVPSSSVIRPSACGRSCSQVRSHSSTRRGCPWSCHANVFGSHESELARWCSFAPSLSTLRALQMWGELWRFLSYSEGQVAHRFQLSGRVQMTRSQCACLVAPRSCLEWWSRSTEKVVRPSTVSWWWSSWCPSIHCLCVDGWQSDYCKHPECQGWTQSD